jgi:hypothetical protein
VKFIIVALLLLIGYTFIYTGLSTFWKGVTFSPNG